MQVPTHLPPLRRSRLWQRYLFCIRKVKKFRASAGLPLRYPFINWGTKQCLPWLRKHLRSRFTSSKLRSPQRCRTTLMTKTHRLAPYSEWMQSGTYCQLTKKSGISRLGMATRISCTLLFVETRCTRGILSLLDTIPHLCVHANHGKYQQAVRTD